jgi:sugar/nucleoside kinase (ribokinase family)
MAPDLEAPAKYNLVFAGNLVIDEVHPYGEAVQIFSGGPAQFSAFAAASLAKKIAVVTRLAPEDDSALDALRGAGVSLHAVRAEQTTYHRVIHDSPNVDERRMVLARNAGFFSLDDFGGIVPTFLHLAGLNDREFTLDLVRGLAARGFTLALDMQAFVRQVDAETGETRLADVPAKKELARLVDKLKLDVIEARVLTGTSDPEQAATTFEGWGAREVMVTRADGVLVRHGGRTYFEPYTNRGVSGRTGRGDTTFGAYLARRLDYGPADALRFAAALASIKMESPGPFHGTEEQVVRRMGEGDL